MAFGRASDIVLVREIGNPGDTIRAGNVGLAKAKAVAGRPLPCTEQAAPGAALNSPGAPTKRAACEIVSCASQTAHNWCAAIGGSGVGRAGRCLSKGRNGRKGNCTHGSDAG